MSDPWGKPWSDNPNAPQIPYWLYFAEKANFAGFLIGAIFYGIVIVLFFQCLGALLSSANRAKGGTKWGLMAYVAAMFSFVTIYTAMNLNLQSVSYIDNREFPGIDGVVPPGPLGYQFFIHAKAISIVPNLMFLLNNWLADGLLIYRCYVIYAMNYGVIAFPSLMFLASFAMGLMFIYQTSQPNGIWNFLPSHIGLPYFSISTALNVILTLIIVARLIPYSRNIRKAIGAPATFSGWCKAALTILIESSLLYAVNSLLFIVPWGVGSYVAEIFLPILAQTQVIAPFLIVLRLANHSALTNSTIISGNTGSVCFASPEKSIGGVGAVPAVNSMDRYKKPGDLGVGITTTISFQHDRV